jgi:hypothetical protein
MDIEVLRTKIPEDCNENTFINNVNTSELLDFFEECGFMYSEKKNQLSPYWDLLIDNVTKLNFSNGEVYRVYVKRDSDGNIVSTGSCYRTLNTTWNCHHLASKNALANKQIILAGYTMINDCNTLAYFRAENRFPMKFFKEVSETTNEIVGAIATQLVELAFYTINSDFVSSKNDERIEFVEYNCEDQTQQQELLRLVTQSRGEVFAACEEIDSIDFNLKNLDTLYGKIGLLKKRVALLAYSENCLIGAVIFNKSSFGINFSCIENRCDFVFRHGIAMNLKEKTIKNALNYAVEYFNDTGIKELNISVNAQDEINISNFPGLKFLRKYMRNNVTSVALPHYVNSIRKFYSRRGV